MSLIDSVFRGVGFLYTLVYIKFSSARLPYEPVHNHPQNFVLPSS